MSINKEENLKGILGQLQLEDSSEIKKHPLVYEPPRTNAAELAGRVVITGIDIRFWDIVRLMILWAIASIPAAVFFILMVFGVLVFLGVGAEMMKAFH